LYIEKVGRIWQKPVPTAAIDLVGILVGFRDFG